MNSQGAEHVINWELASAPEYRQLIAKFKQIEQYLEPPFVVEAVAARRGGGQRRRSGERRLAEMMSRVDGKSAKEMRQGRRRKLDALASRSKRPRRASSSNT